jgi:hypothetical protein
MDLDLSCYEHLIVSATSAQAERRPEADVGHALQPGILGGIGGQLAELDDNCQA